MPRRRLGVRVSNSSAGQRADWDKPAKACCREVSPTPSHSKARKGQGGAGIAVRAPAFSWGVLNRGWRWEGRRHGRRGEGKKEEGGEKRGEWYGGGE